MKQKKIIEKTDSIKSLLLKNPEYKDLILMLKFELGKKYGERHFSSKKIYDAVLNQGVRSVEEFEKL